MNFDTGSTILQHQRVILRALKVIGGQSFKEILMFFLFFSIGIVIFIISS